MTSVKEIVRNRLFDTGIDETLISESALNFAMGKAKEDLCNYCNQPGIPEGLLYTYVDRAVAEFIFFAVATKRIPIENFSQTISAISEGDVSYTYGGIAEKIIDVNNWIANQRKLNLPAINRFRQLNRPKKELNFLDV